MRGFRGHVANLIHVVLPSEFMPAPLHMISQFTQKKYQGVLHMTVTYALYVANYYKKVM